MDKLKFYLEQLHGNTESSETHRRIIEYFINRDNPPEDFEVHDFAKSLAIEHGDLENHIYMILHTMIKKAPGRHKHIPDSQFNPAQLKMGIEVEYEHTDCQKLAKEIAKDHLVEIKDYYTRLLKMENDAKEE